MAIWPATRARKKPWADDMEVNGIIGEINADVLFVPAQRGFMGLEGIDGKTTDHAFGKQSRSGARTGSDDVNPFHPGAAGSHAAEEGAERCASIYSVASAKSAAPRSVKRTCA